MNTASTTTSTLFADLVDAKVADDGTITIRIWANSSVDQLPAVQIQAMRKFDESVTTAQTLREGEYKPLWLTENKGDEDAESNQPE